LGNVVSAIDVLVLRALDEGSGIFHH